MKKYFCRPVTFTYGFILILVSVKPLSGLDQNGDGMSDIWQQQYAVPSADADLDYTGNGLTNRQKSLLGLDPRDPNARFHLDIFNDSANAQLRLQLNTVYGKRYQIESSTDLLSWSTLNSPLIGTGAMVNISLALPVAPAFFRATYIGEVDVDGDGLTAWEENLLRTSDNDTDTDKDGMPDAWEYKYGLNPLVNDAAADPDGDGRSNLQEYQASTDPTDYYNGSLPLLTVYAGGDQRGNPGTILPAPISVVVNGNGRRNAPVTFTVTQGLALLAPDNSGNYAGLTNITVPSTTPYPDAYGFYVAQVYVYLPATAGNISVIKAMVATGSAISSVRTTAVAIDPSLLPPTNLLVTATSPTTAELSWTMASDTTATMVQATLDEGRTWINLGAAGPGVTRVTVRGLTPDYPMSFRVFSTNDYSAITSSFTIPQDPSSLPPPSNEGGDATGSATIQALSQPVLEGEVKYFNLGAWGFNGFLHQNSYLTETAVLTCDAENSVTYIDRIDPITGHQLPRETHSTGSAGCFGFHLGEPNTGEQIISNIEKLTESSPGDVDDFGNPVHKTLRLTLSDQNDEARLRQNAADKLPPFQGNFSQGIDSAYIYVDNFGYGVSALQYRWRVNGDPNLVVTWDVQFRPVNGSVQHNVQHWSTNNNTLSATYPVDPRILNGGANGYYDVFLLMADVAVDGNRDGEMSFNDPAVRDADKTTRDRPYRFWLNDDDDTEISDGTDGNPIGPTETEQIPPSHLDNSLHQIVSKRNLEDFARLWMDLGGAQDALSWGLQIGLKWKNVTDAPAINIYPSADGDGKGDYLSDETAAHAQISDPIFNDAIRDKNNRQTVDKNSTFIFKSDYWGPLYSSPKKCFLFEGAGEGKGELVVVFLDPDGNELAEGGSVWLDLKNVKNMYERFKAQPENIVAPYDATAAFIGPVTYVPDPNGREFQKPWEETDQCAVFVHGWNMSYDDYISFSETMFKRLCWQGYNGHFAAFRWDTRKSDTAFDTGEYNRSENRAFVYGAALKNLVANLSATYTVSIVGHSMGNVVCGEALRQGMQVRNYLMMQAAIPMSCYDANAPQSQRLVERDTQYPTPDHHVSPESHEATLGYRGYLQNVSGTLISFFNPDDWALASGFTVGQETNWESNQLNYKPDGEIADVVHNAAWSYQYDSSYPLSQRAVLSGVSRYVTDSWEMKAFVARSRTKAVGVLDYAAGPIEAKINLRDDYGFGNTRPDHSGQFTRRFQQLDAIYKKMHETLQE